MSQYCVAILATLGTKRYFFEAGGGGGLGVVKFLGLEFLDYELEISIA